MTSTIPPGLAWPGLAFMMLVVGLRYALFNHSQLERYLNHTLAYMLASNLARERFVQDALADAGIMTVATLQYLSLVLTVFTAAEFMGFIAMWSRLSPADVRRRHRYHRLAAVLLSAAFLAAAAPARAAGQTLDVYGGWSSVAAVSCYVIIFCVLAVQLVSLCIGELRDRTSARNERLVAAGGLVIGLAIGISNVEAPVLAVLQQLDVLHSTAYRVSLHGSIFFAESVLTMFLAAVPLALAVGARAGYDVIGRRWRRLQPLRDGMLAAVPQVAYDLTVPSTRRLKTALDLHQTSVQIRDAILQLRPYFRDVPESVADSFHAEHAIARRHRRDAVDALQLAFAVHGKTAGVSPSPIDYGAVLRSRSATLTEETAELLRLARWWPVAEEAAARCQRGAEVSA